MDIYSGIVVDRKVLLCMVHNLGVTDMFVFDTFINTHEGVFQIF